MDWIRSSTGTRPTMLSGLPTVRAVYSIDRAFRFLGVTSEMNPLLLGQESCREVTVNRPVVIALSLRSRTHGFVGSKYEAMGYPRVTYSAPPSGRYSWYCRSPDLYTLRAPYSDSKV